MSMSTTNLKIKRTPLFMDIKVYDTLVPVLVDSGSSLSIVDEKCISPVHKQNVKLWDSTPVLAVNDQPLRIIGSTIIPITVKNHVFHIEVAVGQKLPYNLILGNDILDPWKTNIDYDSKILTINKNIQVPLYCRRNQISSSFNIAAIETTTIPPRSIVVIEGTSDKLIDNESYMIEPLTESTSGIRVARTLSDCHSNILIQVLNTSNAPITIHQHETIATASNFDEKRVNTINTEAVKEAQVELSTIIQQFKLAGLKLTPEQINKLASLIQRNYSLFANSSTQTEANSYVKHQIKTLHNNPIARRSYRHSATENEEIRKQTDEMLKNNVIRPSFSPWAAPVILAPKKDGTKRFCVDYRGLNAATIKDVYPLPRIDETLDALGGAIYFTTLDMAAGYWQVPIEESDKEKSAFITQNGLFEFNVMPFGLTNAPATFQRAMDVLLSGLTWKFCLVYLDDIVIFSKTFEQHLLDLQAVFDRLKSGNWYLKMSKCNFCCSKITYLGHVISAGGVEPDSGKIEVIKNTRTPKDVSEVRQFLGITSYYRRFIYGYAHVAEPLTKLLRQNVTFNWTKDCEESFNILKEQLINSPILAFPDFQKQFILYTDASDAGVGAVLAQIIDDNERVIAYASRTLKTHQKNYSITEKECLAIVEAIKHFRPYLYGKQFTVVVDHNALKWLMEIKDPSSRLTRWSTTLQQYNFEIIYRPGKTHSNADALSRPPILDINVIDTDKDISKIQQRDPELSKYFNFIVHNKLPSNETEQKKIITNSHFMVIENNTLYHLWWPTNLRRNVTRKQLVIPASLKTEVLTACHDDTFGGHLGLEKTFDKIRDRYYWDGMYLEIKNYVESCEICASKKTPRKPLGGKMEPISVTEPFEIVGVDIIGPLPRTPRGNRWIITFSDYLTKWPEAFALPTADSEEIASKLIEEVVCRHGCMEKLLSDRGPAFLSKLAQAVYDALQLKKVNTTAYHPQTDGLVERFNHTLVSMIGTYVKDHQKDWDLYIPYVLFAYRTSIQETTKETPFYLMYGRDAKLPIDIKMKTNTHKPTNTAETYKQEIIEKFKEAYELVQHNMSKSQQKQQNNYNKHHKHIKYPVGSLVWLYVPVVKRGLIKKLARLWKGPFRVMEVMSPVTVKLQMVHNPRRSSIVNIQRLKPYTNRNQSNISLTNNQTETGSSSESEEEVVYDLENEEEYESDEEPDKEILSSENIRNNKPRDISINNSLEPLFSTLESMHIDIKNSKICSINKTKRTLRELLGIGSLFITDGFRQEHFRKLIGNLSNKDDITTFLEKCTTDFNHIFSHEISRIRVTGVTQS